MNQNYFSKVPICQLNIPHANINILTNLNEDLDTVGIVAVDYLVHHSIRFLVHHLTIIIIIIIT